MAARDWLGLSLGLGLAGFGLGMFLAARAPAPAGGSGDQPLPATTVVEVEEEVVPAPIPDPIEIPGIPPATARVLVAEGYAGRSSAEELGIPASVERVLKTSGVVLAVPEAPAREAP